MRNFSIMFLFVYGHVKDTDEYISALPMRRKQGETKTHGRSSVVAWRRGGRVTRIGPDIRNENCYFHFHGLDS